MNKDLYEIINGKKYKKCNDNQIRNLKTMRCVSKKGKIGSEILLLLKKEEPKKEEPKKEERKREISR